jgi:hypothetical protein
MIGNKKLGWKLAKCLVKNKMKCQKQGIAWKLRNSDFNIENAYGKRD